MMNPALAAIIAGAARRFDSEMRRALPENAPRLSVWLKRVPLAKDGSATSALAPRSFPSFAIPFWVTPLSHRETDLSFQHDVAFSTLNGYYFIRLVDNVADNDGPVELRKLLPCGAYFLARFQSAYQRYFPPEHPFWTHFHRWWGEQAEASATDAFLVAITHDDFTRVSSRKFSASKIPLTAAAMRYDRAELIDPWCSFIDRLGAFYQMVNDFFDWRRDLEHGVSTYVLSEWQRQRLTGEALESWFAREGFDWGGSVLRAMIDDIRNLAPLVGTEAMDWVEGRVEVFENQYAKLGASLAAFRHVVGLFSSPRQPATAEQLRGV